ncbi:MAG: phosphodiester glycosidase family protein [Clostridia bacterium]|nr:phosphodiester glycosidase family protein [Clostridia bacterium]
MRKYLRRKTPKKPMRLFMLILLDLGLIGIALITFAYFHHVRPTEETPLGTTLSHTYRRSSALPTFTPAPANTPVPTAIPEKATEAEAVVSTETPMATIVPELTPAPTPDPVGYFGSIHADKFTTGEVISEKDRYISENVSITVTKHKENGTIYHLADIYIRDISSFRTLFAEDKFGKGYSESTYKADLRSDSILTISGDFYGLRNYGVIVRNGQPYRTMKSAICDWCVLYWDGTMECYRPGPVGIEAIMEKGAYQSWYFGPMLLDENGQPMTTFNSNVEKSNPRCAIGYYEPGHYCFIVVEGRTEKSKGLSLAALSNLMYSLGCKVAYNLDGGETAQMVFDDRTQNVLLNNGRKCSDFVMITEPTFE